MKKKFSFKKAVFIVTLFVFPSGEGVAASPILSCVEGYCIGKKIDLGSAGEQSSTCAYMMEYDDYAKKPTVSISVSKIDGTITSIFRQGNYRYRTVQDAKKIIIKKYGRPQSEDEGSGSLDLWYSDSGFDVITKQVSIYKHITPGVMIISESIVDRPKISLQCN